MEEVKFEFVSGLDSTSVRRLPEKGSKYAAGYDFYNPIDTWIGTSGVTYVRTGIKAKFPRNMALLILNRSSNPRNKKLIMANGVGLVDSDYYNNEDNEGEICFEFMTTDNTPVFIAAGEKLGQGVFIEYKDVTNLDVDKIPNRTGGFGSTRSLEWR